MGELRSVFEFSEGRIIKMPHSVTCCFFFFFKLYNIVLVLLNIEMNKKSTCTSSGRPQVSE